eukprot:1194902-Prorocentrum_minimum.AAC.4
MSMLKTVVRKGLWGVESTLAVIGTGGPVKRNVHRAAADGERVHEPARQLGELRHLRHVRPVGLACALQVGSHLQLGQTGVGRAAGGALREEPGRRIDACFSRAIGSYPSTKRAPFPGNMPYSLTRLVHVCPVPWEYALYPDAVHAEAEFFLTDTGIRITKELWYEARHDPTILVPSKEELAPLWDHLYEELDRDNVSLDLQGRTEAENFETGASLDLQGRTEADNFETVRRGCIRGCVKGS